MTLRRIVPLVGLLGALGAAVTVILRRRRAGGTDQQGFEGREYEVRDGVIDLTGAATADQVPDVIKGVAEVPGGSAT